MRSFRFLSRTQWVRVCLSTLWVLFPQYIWAQQESLLREFEGELQRIVENAKPSVVTVVGRFSTAVEARGTGQGLLGLFSEKSHPRQMTFMNVASGLIIDTSGVVITKSSIVEGADSIGVQLYDGRILPATFVGSDPESGLSLLRIADVDLAPANLAQQAPVRVGSWVTIIGNSLGISPSVSFGVVNGLRGNGMIQLSAHLIPGNNGSPIFNTSGEVVGIIAGWVSLLDGFTSPEPIPYVTEGTIAYPISTVLAIKDKILLGQQERGAWLGIEVRSGEAPFEALVTEVEKGSPAADAGLRVGDRIVGCNGKKVGDVRDLKSIVSSAYPGDRLNLDVLREDKPVDVQIILGERTDSVDWPSVAGQPRALDFPSNAYLSGRTRSAPSNQVLEERIRHLERELETLRAMLKKRP